MSTAAPRDGKWCCEAVSLLTNDEGRQLALAMVWTVFQVECTETISEDRDDDNGVSAYHAVFTNMSATSTNR
jgi:hypothetical protein